VVLAVAALAAMVIADFRWLRVMQREHYIPGTCLTVALRWARKRPPNQVLAPVLGAAALLALLALPGLRGLRGLRGLPAAVAVSASLVAAAGAAAFPVAMPFLRGEQRMVRTPRLGRLAASGALLEMLLAAGALRLGVPAALGTLAAGVPVVIDGAALIVRPVEARLARRYRTRARATLDRVAPRVIAITGSYGKTSTKNHVRDLLAGILDVVASPASWNNAAGLARTVNEYVGPATQVLVAEMGTYGVGEIREMCSWVKPEIGIITAIGPMHLERMKTLDTVARAKSELLEGIRVAILNVDDERLAQIAGSARGADVWRCGTQRQPGLDVSLERDDDVVTIRYRGTPIGSFRSRPELHLANIACALAAAFAAGAPPGRVVTRISELSVPAHRVAAGVSSSGLVVIDDTFSSNPRGARHALDLLESAVPDPNRRAVVTPGMVELGPEQDEANRAFAEAAAKADAVLVVVGWTNRRALLAGARNGETVTVASRAAARQWVRSALTAGDGVLWENDLPDHYP
jgi:UDP-N-acetylmuramoyl-tripeptide--D-alanyl-D-alanine ligase